MSDLITEYIDLEGGVKRLMGNKNLYNRLLGSFLTGTDNVSLKESLDAGDYQKAGAIAHAIKGVTGNLSLNKLFETTTKIMNQLREGVYNEADCNLFFEQYELTRQAVTEYLETQK